MNSDDGDRDGDVPRDPVRLRLIEAMERRAAAHCGEARRLIDERVATLRAESACAGQIVAGGGAHMASIDGPSSGALAGLVAHMASRASSRHGGQPQDSNAESASPVASTEIESLAYFRSTWSRLSAERRLKRSLATVPDNAGPLNSHQLVHRALQTMRETSPGYLQHFMTYADALLWVDQAGGDGVSGGVTSAQSKPTKKMRNAVRSKTN